MRILSLCGMCLTVFVAAAWAADPPQARLSEASHDHGTVFIGATVKGTFAVENTGTAPFAIVEAKTSCHCTTAVVSKDPIPPGGRGEVSYEITASSAGKSVKSIRVITEPPLPEPLTFSASVTYAPFIEAAPKDLAVDLNQGDALDIRVPLQIAKGAEGLELLGATTRSRDVAVALERAADGAGYVLAVKSTAPLPTGKRGISVELEYDKQGKGVQHLTVTANVTPTVQVTPAPIMVKFEGGSNEAVIPVTLENTKGYPFTVTSVSARACSIGDVALPAAAATEHVLSVPFRRPAEQQPMRGYLTFEFGGDLGKQTVFVVYQRELRAAPAAAAPGPAAPGNSETR